MAIAVKEVFRGTTYTEGTISRRYDRARIVCYVSGLADTRDQLDQAVTSARTGRLVHPDNTALPLRYATARWARGGDDGDNAAAWVELIYDKTGSQQATDSTEFSVIADIDVYHEQKFWYGTDLGSPSGIGTGNGSTDVYYTKHPLAPFGGKIMPGHWLDETYMSIRVPVVLADSPISDSFAVVGTVNDATFTISDKAFPANTLRYEGLRQRATKIDDGSSVTYEFAVGYAFTYAKHGWFYSFTENDSGTIKVCKDLSHDEATWSSSYFPTS